MSLNGISRAILRSLHSGANYGGDSPKIPPPPTAGGTKILNPDNTPRTVDGPANNVFYCGQQADHGHYNTPQTMTYLRPAIEGVPKGAPTCQGTIAYVSHTYVADNGGIFKFEGQISLQDLQAYRDFVNTGSNVHPANRESINNKLDLLQRHMENGIPDLKASGDLAGVGVHQYYSDQMKGRPELHDRLNGRLEDGTFVRNPPTGQVPTSVSYNSPPPDPRTGKISPTVDKPPRGAPETLATMKSKGELHVQANVTLATATGIPKKPPPGTTQSMGVS